MIELDGESLIVSPAELVTSGVADLIRARKQAIIDELAGANQWTGEAADLVEWFNANRHRLPSEAFVLEYWPDGVPKVEWSAPAEHYQEIWCVIQKGPTSSMSRQLISLIVQLRKRFGLIVGSHIDN